MTAPQATDLGAFLDRLEETHNAVADYDVEALLAEHNATPALIAAVRVVLALADELDGLVDDETVDETARIAHAWTLRRLRSAVTAALGETGGEL